MNIFRENLPKRHHECSYDPRTHTRSASKETNSHQPLSSRSLNQQTSPLKTTIQSMKTSLGITYSRVPLICSTVFSLVLTFYPLLPKVHCKTIIPAQSDRVLTRQSTKTRHWCSSCYNDFNKEPAALHF